MQMFRRSRPAPAQPAPEQQPPPVQQPAQQPVQRPAHRPADPRPEPPGRFLCPITLSIMDDPVMSPHGINFERAAIVEWLGRNANCPCSRRPLSARELFPNLALREEIGEWRRIAGMRPAPTVPHRLPTPPVPGVRTPPVQTASPTVAPLHYARSPYAPRGSAPPPRQQPPWQKYGLSQTDYDYICALFINFDDDDGGTLDKLELTRLATWLNYPHSPADIDEMFREMDSDGNGELDMDEFLQYYQRRRPDPTKLYGLTREVYNNVLFQFHTFDADRNGCLDQAEFHQLATKLGISSSRQNTQRIFAAIDLDRNGSVDLHEFLMFMRNHRRRA
eukprot:TRINITY_DN398_c0_g1_i1.p1 TRINITY_DN398_c0_g1~~TRINITY_DN398_c0_g1_i1.p1  ORF type:complete len:333 (+),score=116.05 TRINITY_DN398_c0_g1_i1:64-1062(+)